MSTQSKLGRYCLSLCSGAVVATVMFTGAVAQTPQAPAVPSKQSLESPVSCNSAGMAEPATRSETHSASGTAPGNTGSTGWTGGTGGAHTGTNPQGALPESKTWQPPTARGLDLAMAPPSENRADNGNAGCS
jgi:hypothetical protein